MPDTSYTLFGPPAAHAPATDPFLARLAGRCVTHAAPLHYFPSIVAAGRLLSARAGESRGIAPRASAARRDRMLGVDRYIHLAFDLVTPLLADKLGRGMPHLVLTFNAARAYAENPAACALLPCNTKAYRSRAACAPERGAREMAALLKSRDEFRRYPSLEFLVEAELPLGSLVEITAFCERDAAVARAVLHAFAPDLAILLTERSVPNYPQALIDSTHAYCHACIAAARALPPPKIGFD